MAKREDQDTGFSVLAFCHIVLAIVLFPMGIMYLTTFPYLVAVCFFLLGLGVRMIKLGRSCDVHVIKVHKLLIAIEILFGCYGGYAVYLHNEENLQGMMTGKGEMILGLALLLATLSIATVAYLPRAARTNL